MPKKKKETATTKEAQMAHFEQIEIMNYFLKNFHAECSVYKIFYSKDAQKALSYIDNKSFAMIKHRLQHLMYHFFTRRYDWKTEGYDVANVTSVLCNVEFCAHTGSHYAIQLHFYVQTRDNRQAWITVDEETYQAFYRDCAYHLSSYVCKDGWYYSGDLGHLFLSKDCNPEILSDVLEVNVYQKDDDREDFCGLFVFEGIKKDMKERILALLNKYQATIKKKVRSGIGKLVFGIKVIPHKEGLQICWSIEGVTKDYCKFGLSPSDISNKFFDEMLAILNIWAERYDLTFSDNSECWISYNKKEPNK